MLQATRSPQGLPYDTYDEAHPSRFPSSSCFGNREGSTPRGGPVQPLRKRANKGGILAYAKASSPLSCKYVVAITKMTANATLTCLTQPPRLTPSSESGEGSINTSPASPQTSERARDFGVCQGPSRRVSKITKQEGNLTLPQPPSSVVRHPRLDPLRLY